MGDKIIAGPINSGLKKDVTAFVIDNDSFPTLINAYQWRGRVKRKRGTSFLTRLRRFVNSLPLYGGFQITLDGSGNGNLLTPFQVNGNIIPGIFILDNNTGNLYTDPGLNGILVGVPGGTGTINYASGAITIAGGAGHLLSFTFFYNPALPVMGLEDLILNVNQYPGTMAFDTKYSYIILQTFPYLAYDVSFYKIPTTAENPTYTGYIQKAVMTPTSWNGQDYQQFWTVNYQGALWATNGINIPFNTTNIGMQFKRITGIVIDAVGPPAIATLTIASHGLVQGDFVFINEVVGINGINWQTGYVISAEPQAVNTVQVEFPQATLSGAYISGGIAQYLTNRSDPTLDCIRWYDGDPTNGSATAPAQVEGHGWVNFMPPLSQRPFSIADLPPKIYYLVGARLIVPFKDRLLFLGPVIQSSDLGAAPIYLQDTIIYSQNGTPYYTSSYTNPIPTNVDFPTSPALVPNSILVPVNQTASPAAWFEDSTGFGGNITAGVDSPILTAGDNEDVLIIGFSTLQARLVYSGDDVIPFNFYTINTEFGAQSTFSAINMDESVFSQGTRGIIFTSQVKVQRNDLDIPDQVFEMSLISNGAERVTAQRDFINEWIYLTYCDNVDDRKIYRFPNQTLQYNYRDASWAIHDECYTTYGQFRKTTGFTWNTVGTVYPTWNQWNDPWNSGQSTIRQPEIIGGNQQGFVLVKDTGTGEGNSLTIQNLTGTTVTSPNHGLNENDFIIITGVIGTLGPSVNGKIFQVSPDVTQNTFVIDPLVPAGTYFGGGLIKRMYRPFIQTKQFPPAWGMARKTRIGVQQYLFTTTERAQIQLLIFLSQNSTSSYNSGSIVPSVLSLNDSLIYSTVLYTCPESTNLGLTPANINLQMISEPPLGSSQQAQIWHRINTSLIGDTIQLGFTMSDAQMSALVPSGVSFTITAITQATQAVLTVNNTIGIGQQISISGVVGMTELNFSTTLNNTYNVVASSTTSITINVDSTAFGAYVSGGSVIVVSPIYQFSEIELHGFILDVTQSQLLA